MKNWTIENQDGVCLLTLDKQDSSQNVLSSHILEELSAIVDEIEANKPQALIIASGKDNGFIAGADVSEFAKRSRAQNRPHSLSVAPIKYWIELRRSLSLLWR